MQVLWSRIAQTTASCCCPSCKASASGIARRAATATGKRPSRYFTSSTLLYSGIFAAAATHDAAIKIKRREQWDHAIADVQHGSGAETTQAGLGIDDGEGMQEKMELGHGQLGTESTIYTPTDEQAETTFEGLSSRAGAPTWPENTGANLVRYNLPPLSVYAMDHSRDKAGRRAWTPKKIRTLELSVDKLVLRILLYLDSIRFRIKALQDTPAWFRKVARSPRSNLEKLLADTKEKLTAIKDVSAQAKTEELRDLEPIFTSYQHDHEGNYVHATRELDQSFGRLFQQHQLGELSRHDMLVKICCNLAVSSAPPNLTCYNSLLGGLSQTRNHAKLFRMITRSMEESHVRMNEESMSLILTHYCEFNQEERFLEFVEKMRGLRNGLSLARPDVQINAKSQGRLIRVETATRVKVLQKPYPTPPVFEALIRGVLHSSGFGSALRICQTMGHEGWGLSMRGLTPLLADCVERADWHGGNAVWEQIQRVGSKSRRRDRAEQIPLGAYAAMLRLCCRCDQRTEFHTVMHEAMITGHSQRILLGMVERHDDEPVVHETKSSSRVNGGRIDYRESFVQQPLGAPVKPPHGSLSKSEQPRDALSFEQLTGMLPASEDLEAYEAAERPMSLSG